MTEKIHNGAWPARMALGEKLQPLGVEILVRHPSLGRTKGRSNQHRSNRSPRPHRPTFTGGTDTESLCR
jgi:hypothetical protein